MRRRLCTSFGLSKEPAEVFEKCGDDGFIRRQHLSGQYIPIVRHCINRSSDVLRQYGQLMGSFEVETAGLREKF